MGEGGMMARRLGFRWIAAIATLQLAGGCAMTDRNPPDTLPMIAPGHVLVLPQPGDLGRSVEATQLITVRRGSDIHAFEGHISVTPERLLLVGLDGMGRRALTLTWDKSGKVSGATAKWMKDPVPPGPMLADLIVLYWPEASVRGALAGADATLVAKPGSRSVMADGAEILHVDFQGSAQASWSGSLRYRNDAWGYEIDVQSVEATP
jgi:uncharacterized protein DUF3261